jgi:hypothetical protein
MATERVAFSITPNPFSILVAFIARDVHNYAAKGISPYSLEDIYGAHYVHFVCFDRLSEGVSNKRLRGHMEDNIGSHGFN